MIDDAWLATTLGEVCDIRGGGTPSTAVPAYWGGDIPWLTPTEVVKADGGRVHTSDRMITESGLAHSSAKLLPRGTVLVTTRASVGFAAVADVPVATNQGFQSLVPSDAVLPEYLTYWVQAHRSEFVSRAGGSTFAEIGKAKVGSIPIMLPPLAVQSRVVDLVAHLDACVRSLAAEQVAARMLLTCLRQSVASSGAMVPLSTLAANDGIQIGPFGSQLHASEYSTEGVPVVMPRDLIRGRISEAKIKRVPAAVAERLARHRLRPGDVVFARRGDLSKRALISSDQDGWLCGTGCLRFRPAPGVNGSQVFEAISGDGATSWLVEHAVGTTMLNLNTAIISRLPVADPKTASSPVMASCAATAELAESLVSEERSLRQARMAILDRFTSGLELLPDAYDLFLDSVA